MIIANITGGLGNQMFQYAAGKALANHLQTEFKLDISGFQKYKLHKFCLDKFQIKNQIATNNEIRKIIFYKNSEFIKQILLKITKRLKKEKYFHFNEDFFDSAQDCYIYGYWQSEKYFKNIENEIRQEFIPINAPDGKNLEILKIIKDSNSVSIHIRRGDYVTNKHTNSYHGTCALDYYQKAIEKIKEHEKAPTFFIFSDDPNWAKENLKINEAKHFINFNGPDKNYEDLRLMSSCKHNIIANSSFSWWGAWLNGNPKKIVIAPIAWFAAAEINTDDLLPKEWIKI